MKKIYLSLVLLVSVLGAIAQSAPDVLTYPHTSSGKNVKKKDSRKMMQGTLTTVTPYVAGTTMNLNFTLNVTNLDDEYGDSLALTFPAGIVPNSSPNNPLYVSPDPMATPEAYNGVFGQVISWGDDDNNYGGISTPATVVFTVNVTVAPGVTGVKTGTFHLSGDGFGPNPGDLNGTFTLSDVAPAADLEVTDISDIRYYSMPLIHFPVSNFTAAVANNGGNLTNNVNVNFNVAQEGYSSTVPLQNPLNNGQVDTVTSSAFNPTIRSLHTLVISAVYPADQNQADNADTTTFNLTDSVFSYNSGNTVTAMPLGVSAGGSIGASYELQEKDTLTSVTVFFKKTALGSQARVSVYQFADTVRSLIAQTATVTFSDSLEKTVTFNLSPDLVLPAGGFFVAVDQVNASNYGLGTSFENFTPNTIFARVGATGGYRPLESFGAQFARTPYIQANFGTPDASSGIGAVSGRSLKLFPNPGNGMFTLEVQQASQLYVYNYMGVLVQTLEVKEGTQSIDLTGLSAGQYTLNLVSPVQTTAIQLSIVR
jgi:hypothetical protein